MSISDILRDAFGELLDLVERHASGRQSVNADPSNASLVHFAELRIAEAVIDDGDRAGARLSGRGGHVECTGIVLAIDARLHDDHAFEPKARRQCIA